MVQMIKRCAAGTPGGAYKRNIRPGSGCLCSRSLRSRIDFDPVVAHFGADDRAGRLRDNHVGRFDRHVTVDAVLDDRVAEPLRLAATRPLVALEARSRIRGGGLFGSVGVVAGGTGHLRRRLVAAAALRGRPGFRGRRDASAASVGNGLKKSVSGLPGTNENAGVSAWRWIPLWQ